MMVGSINKVVLVGRLGGDPEIQSLFPSGVKMCRLSVVTCERWKEKKTGEDKVSTEWHTVEVHQNAAVNFAEAYLTKGRLVYIEGRLETRKWQNKSGQSGYTTLVSVRPNAGAVIGLDRRPKEFGQRVEAKPRVRPIEFGKKFTIEAHDTGQRSTYEIVSGTESNIKMGLINREAPLARALIRCLANDEDEVQVRAPGGIRIYTIIKIEPEVFQMDLNIERSGELLISTPSGRLDGTNSRKFEESLKSEISGSKCSVVLDFKDLNYISSAGLRAILLIAKSVRADNTNLALCSLSDNIREVFEISGFDRIIPIHKSREDAVQSLQG